MTSPVGPAKELFTIWPDLQTSAPMDIEYHTDQMGHLLGTLHALEMLLRVCLANNNDDVTFDWSELPVGKVVPATRLTRRDLFSDLLKEYNTDAAKKGTPTLDADLTCVRNAIVHGRVIMEKRWLPARMVDFTNGKGGMCVIVFNERLTADWYRNALLRFGRAYSIVLLTAIDQGRASVTPAYEASLRAGVTKQPESSGR